MKYLIICIALAGYLKVSAQSAEWIRGQEIDYQFNPGMLNYVVDASEQNTVWYSGMIEFVEFYQEAMGDLFLMEFDADGNVLNQFVIGGSALVVDLESGPDGTIYLAGQNRTGLLFPDGYFHEYAGSFINSFLARLTTEGQTDWVIDLGVLFPESVIEDILPVDDRLYVAHSEWTGSMISQFDPDGNLLSSVNQSDVSLVTSIAVDQEGNLYATGSCAGNNCQFGGVTYATPFSYNFYLVKYNASGSPQWVHFVEDITCISPFITLDQDENIIWAGGLNIQATFDTLTLLGPQWSYDLFVTGFNPQGNVQWGIEVPQVTGGDASVAKHATLAVLPDEGFVLGGFTRGSIDWGNGVITQAAGFSQEIMNLGFSQDGHIIWGKTGGGEGHESPMSWTADEYGNIYFTGIGHGTVTFDTCSFTAESFYYPFLVKMNTSGITGSNEFEPSFDITIAPNPAVDDIFISSPVEIEYIHLFDSSGTLLGIITGKNRIDTRTLTTGLYLLVIYTKGGMISSKKFVVI